MIEGSDDGILVGKVLKDSIAQDAGLQKGDVITEAAGSKVRKVGDLISIIKSINPGMWLPLSVKRGDQYLDLIAPFPAPQADETN